MIEKEIEVDGGVVVAAPGWLQLEKRNRYGSVPGLEDEELVDPGEMERQVMAKEWAPVLELPCGKGQGGVVAAVDENGGLDWGAFGTVDFERTRPAFDKARYKAEKLKERLKDVMILFGMVKERLAGRGKYLVLKYVKMGVIGMDEIVDADMRSLARLYLRARKLRDEIFRLEEASRRREKARVEAWLEALG